MIKPPFPKRKGGFLFFPVIANQSTDWCGNPTVKRYNFKNYAIVGLFLTPPYGNNVKYFLSATSSLGGSRRSPGP